MNDTTIVQLIGQFGLGGLTLFFVVRQMQEARADRVFMKQLLVLLLKQSFPNADVTSIVDAAKTQTEEFSDILRP